MRDDPDPLIEQTAIHLSEAGATWPKITPSLREGWRYLAQRAAEVLRPGIGSREGEPVPDDHLIVAATVVLAKHSGSLTNRRADATMREIIARDWIAQLRLSGYQNHLWAGRGPSQHPRRPAGGAMIPSHRLFVIEHASSRLAISAADAGRARGIAAMMLFGNPYAPQRDAMVVREPEEEERKTFVSRQYAPTSEVALAAVML